MEIQGKRFLVAGATGVLGGLLSRDLVDQGARVVLAGRDAGRLAKLGQTLDAPTVALDYSVPDASSRCVETAFEALGGLEGLVVATGAVAFGTGEEVDESVVRELFEVNALGPIGLIRAAVSRLESPGAVVALSAVVADHPTAGMAAYSASKAALSAYLDVIRRENRGSGLVVLDVRPQHMDTGFASRARSGMPPRLPEPGDHHAVARQIISALKEDRCELAYDLNRGELVAG